VKRGVGWYCLPISPPIEKAQTSRGAFPFKDGNKSSKNRLLTYLLKAIVPTYRRTSSSVPELVAEKKLSGGLMGNGASEHIEVL
jgi:hypothetical protein